MREFVLIVAAIYGALAIILGAFGAHALKKLLSPEQLNSFETGVKYQMYHAILLLVLGFQLNFSSFPARFAVILIILGTFLFSFSIYGLCLSAAKGSKIKILGPITPLGGLLLVLGWLSLLYMFIT